MKSLFKRKLIMLQCTHKLALYSFFLPALMLLMISCNKEQLLPPADIENNAIQKNSIAASSQSARAGAMQLSGVGFFAEAGECTSSLGDGAYYAVKMTGDLEGCLYIFVDVYNCSPSGTYREEGRELFIGTYKGGSGRFWTTYKFEAKFEGCAPDGAPLGAEIFGRCQHPIVNGSGTGVFSGVTGRLDFKDDIEAGNFPYRGHLRF